MSAGAVVMMIVAMIVVWGGLAAAILMLRGHPDEQRDGTPAGEGG
ncbi:methionine/alanine import family NSS transporter small subunit [Streptomyces sp. TRM 70361]|nr:methionine/alanine import family NSS transporter small subunit [Streptomyces sp. TRM 70361]MEE1942513.1 methionine/alanine import family NSS transporter small subunit [Streptomyces sp. TRM 70361]